MNRSTIVRRGVAASVAAAGLAVGGIGIATAADDESQSTDSSAVANSSDGERRGHGGHRGGMGGGPATTELAEALGVSEDDLQAAFEAVRGERGDRGPRTEGERPTEGDREERKQEMASALAAELGVSEDDVTAAFDELQSDHQADRRTALAERLDEAVSSGDLTQADSESVLKAYDAGVLGGDRGGH